MTWSSENKQATQGNELTRQSIYSRRWNLIFYRIAESSSEEDCDALVRNVLTDQLHLSELDVNNMKFCGVHRLGKPTRRKSRRIIVRFTCRADRDLVWKCRYRLKDATITMGENFLKHIQEIRKP